MQAELANSFASVEQLDARLKRANIDLIEMPRLALFLSWALLTRVRAYFPTERVIAPDA